MVVKVTPGTENYYYECRNCGNVVGNKQEVVKDNKNDDS